MIGRIVSLSNQRLRSTDSRSNKSARENIAETFFHSEQPKERSDRPWIRPESIPKLSLLLKKFILGPVPKATVRSPSVSIYLLFALVVSLLGEIHQKLCGAFPALLERERAARVQKLHPVVGRKAALENVVSVEKNESRDDPSVGAGRKGNPRLSDFLPLLVPVLVSPWFAVCIARNLAGLDVDLQMSEMRGNIQKRGFEC